MFAYADAEFDGTVTIVVSANDLSCDESILQELASKCNEINLELVHFNDIEEDFLTGDIDTTN